MTVSIQQCYDKIMELESKLNQYTISRDKDIQGTIEKLDELHNTREENLKKLMSILTTRIDQIEQKDREIILNSDTMLRFFDNYINNQTSKFKSELESLHELQKTLTNKIDIYNITKKNINTLEESLKNGGLSSSLCEYLSTQLRNLKDDINKIDVDSIRREIVVVQQKIDIINNKLMKIEYLN